MKDLAEAFKPYLNVFGGSYRWGQEAIVGGPAKMFLLASDCTLSKVRRKNSRFLVCFLVKRPYMDLPKEGKRVGEAWKSSLTYLGLFWVLLASDTLCFPKTVQQPEK